MYNPRITISIINFLNEWLYRDPDAVHNLVHTRVKCNEWTADHPTIQVVEKDGETAVGMLGVLNGICGACRTTGRGYIVAILSDKTGKIVRFENLTNIRESAE